MSKEVDRTMGENSLDIAIAEIRTNTDHIKETVDFVRDKVDSLSSTVTGLQFQIKAVDELKSDMDKMREEHKRDIEKLRVHSAEQDAKLTKLLTYATVIAVVASALVSGLLGDIGKNLIKHETVTASAPASKSP